MRVEGRGCWGEGSRVWGVRFRVQGSGIRDQGLGSQGWDPPKEVRSEQVYLNRSVDKVVLQMSNPARIRQLILYHHVINTVCEMPVQQHFRATREHLTVDVGSYSICLT